MHGNLIRKKYYLHMYVAEEEDELRGEGLNALADMSAKNFRDFLGWLIYPEKTILLTLWYHLISVTMDFRHYLCMSLHVPL